MNYEGLKNKINEIGVYSLIEDYPKNTELTYVEKESTGSYDEGNEKLTKVLFFPEFEMYVRFTGVYESYGEGTSWDGHFQQVFPKEVTSIIYTPSKY